MGVAYNTSIVRSGLVLHLDAANSKCFGPDQTTCQNMVTNGLLTGANGQPNAGTHTPDPNNFPEYNSINGGIFDFAGGRGMNVEEDLGAHTEFSIEMWYNTGGTPGTTYFADGRNNGGEWFLSNYVGYNITYSNVANYNFDVTYDIANPDFINRWQHMILTSDASESKIHIDGTERTVIGGTSVNENLGKNFRIGARFTGGNRWTGYMGPVRIYNRALTAAEVKQNFEALRGRYGI